MKINDQIKKFSFKDNSFMPDLFKQVLYMCIYTHPDNKMLAVWQQIRSDSHCRSICVRIKLKLYRQPADMLCQQLGGRN